MKMLLERIVERNPNLIEAAVRLHQAGVIPPNTWLYDLDVIADNARALARGARENGLTTYIMTKQYARNPMVSMTAISQGMHKTVAVDIHGAKMMHRYGVPVGHIGHLNQIPMFDVARALDIQPEVITVYTVEAARRISEAAVRKGLTQDVLVRVYRPGDVFFAGQEGGFREQDVVDAARQIQRLPGVQVVGVTSFPVVSYSYREPMHLNPNMATIVRAASQLERELGIHVKQINAPGNTSTQTFGLLKSAGATHVEPGTGLLGTSAGHIVNGDAWVEKPSYVYVSEVSHHWEGRAYAFAGGLWSLMHGSVGPGWPRVALVGSDPKAVFDNPLPYDHMDQIIDYHIPLEHGERARIGDTVVMGIGTQAQMTRSHTAAVSGTSTGRLKVWGIFDHATTQLDSEYNPVPPAQVKQQLRELVELYAPVPAVG
jgi:predicted amino acid racemase